LTVEVKEYRGNGLATKEGKKNQGRGTAQNNGSPRYRPNSKEKHVSQQGMKKGRRQSPPFADAKKSMLAAKGGFSANSWGKETNEWRGSSAAR